MTFVSAWQHPILLIIRFLLFSLSGFFFLSGCASLPPNTGQVTTALQDVDDTRLARAMRVHEERHPGQSGFLLLNNGLDALVARAALAEAADKTIDIQYYLFHDDIVGNLLAYKLLEAAERGVRLRLLLDDMGLDGRDREIAALSAHPNIEIRVFNPFTRGMIRSIQFLTRFGDVTRRMHNKTFTADNRASIAGGRNIGNEYFNADPDLAFGDLDILAIGPVVKEVSASFDTFWNSTLSWPIEDLATSAPVIDFETKRIQWETEIEKQRDSEYVQALRNSDLNQRILTGEQLDYEWGEARVLVDKPEKISSDVQKKEYYLAPKLKKHLEKTEKELIILSAYFVPGREGVRFLRSLQKKGVQVRIFTNSLASNDVPFVHAGYARYRRDLLRAGIELYEMDRKLDKKEYRQHKKENKKTRKIGQSKSSLHAKTFIMDRENLFISSFNFDPRSIKINTEIGILFHAPVMAGKMAAAFDHNIEEKAFTLEMETEEDGVEMIRWVNTDANGKRLVYTNDPYTSFMGRLLLGITGWLPIESQL